jgi:hypothetical protein
MSDQKQLHRDTILRVRAFACPACNSFAPFEVDRCAARLLDGNWISLFVNRVNTAMGKIPWFSFTIPQPVVPTLVLLHREVAP